MSRQIEDVNRRRIDNALGRLREELEARDAALAKLAEELGDLGVIPPEHLQILDELLPGRVRRGTRAPRRLVLVPDDLDSGARATTNEPGADTERGA